MRTALKQPIEVLLDVLPFSSAADVSSIEEDWSEAAGMLGLSSRAVPLVCRADVALEIESGCRRGWWHGAPDPLRDAIHRFKARMHRIGDGSPEFAATWSAVESQVGSCLWRDHVRRICQSRTQVEAAYLRRAVRSAQQLWNRAGRWAAALPDEPNPFLPLIELVRRGVWPVGCRDGAVQLLQLRASGTAEVPGAQQRFVREPSSAGRVFLSGPFRDEFTGDILRLLQERGLEVVHGRVSESIAPEQQLGAGIKHSSACVAAVREHDADFGLPWWTFQELDFALACGVPAAILSASPESLAIEGAQTFRTSSRGTEEGFWAWLDAVL